MKHLPKITLMLIAVATLYACNKKDDVEAMTPQYRHADTLHTRDSIDPWTGDTIVIVDPYDTVVTNPWDTLVTNPYDTVVTNNPYDTIWNNNPYDTIRNNNPYDTVWHYAPDSIWHD